MEPTEPLTERVARWRDLSRWTLVQRGVLAILVVAGTWFVGRGAYVTAIETSHFARIAWSHAVAIPDDYQLNRAKRRVESGESITKEAMAAYQAAADAGKVNIDRTVEAKNSGVEDPRPLKVDTAAAFPSAGT